jgi:hypothetical protein
LVSGVDFVDASIRLLLGRPVVIPTNLANQGACCRFLFAPSGKLLSAGGIEEARRLPNVVALDLTCRQGSVIREAEHGGQRAGCIVTQGADRREAMVAADQAESLVKWCMSPVEAENDAIECCH